MIQSIERAAAILNIFRSRNSASIAEMASLLNLPKTTIHGIVKTLRKEDLLYQDPVTKDYSLGISLFELASIYSTRMDIRTIAMPMMRTLAESTGDTVQLAILNGRSIVYLAKITTPSFLNFSISSGVRAPAHCTSTGKTCLAFMPEDQVKALYEGVTLEKRTPHTVSCLTSLLRQLIEVRKMGYSIERQEVEIGLGGISVPLFNSDNMIVGAVCISFPVDRCTNDYLSHCVPELKKCGRQISRKLGCNVRSLSQQIYDTSIF